VRKRLCLLLVLLGVALSSSAAADATIAVELLGRVRVAGRDVRLGDVARLDVARLDSTTAARLARVSLGRTPEPGSARTIRAGDVRAALAAAGFAPGAVTVAGAAVTAVEPETALLSGPVLAACARRFALAALGRSDDLDLEAIAPLPPAEVEVAVGRERSSLRARWQETPAAGATAVTVVVEVEADGETTVAAALGLRIRRTVLAAVPARTITKGSAIDPASLVRVRLELEDAASWLLSPEDAAGCTACSDLKAGAPIARADVVAPLAVKRGDKVSVALVKGMLTVAGEGVAMKDGAVGETIPVKAGHEPLRCRVVRKGHVEVNLGGAP
jgi:flagella basal body P-ring formation protein FlgA